MEVTDVETLIRGRITELEKDMLKNEPVVNELNTLLNRIAETVASETAAPAA